MRNAVALLALLALAGCAGPRPDAPAAAAVTPPTAWRTDIAAGGEIKAEWWQGFGDPALTQVVELALSKNDDVAIAASRVEEARAQFRLVEGQRLPSVGAGIGGVRERTVDAFGQAVVDNAGQAELSISYDADLFGRLSSLSGAARASILASEASRDNVRLAVAASAASGYINLRSLDARLVVLRDTLAVRAESLRIARRRAEAGYSTQLELEQAAAEYHATEQSIPAIELAISRQEDGLSVLLGENPQAIARGLDFFSIVPPPAPAGLPSALLRRRPDIMQAEQQIVAADKSLDAARASFMPSVQLTADAGYVYSSLISINPVAVFSLGGSILAPIFEGGRLQAAADTAAARRDQAAFAYRKTALNAFREVEDALITVRKTGEQEQFLRQQREALALALVQATNRYRAGYSSYIEQLDAQRGLLSVELSLIQVRSDQLIGVVNLFQALGGGWQFTASPDASH